MTASPTTPAAMPSEEDKGYTPLEEAIAKAICAATREFDWDTIDESTRWQFRGEATAVLNVIAPILAEKERQYELASEGRAAFAARALAAEAALAAERERCARFAERISQAQAAGWRENPKTDGCGGAIAASNTGMFIAAAIRAEGE